MSEINDTEDIRLSALVSELLTKADNTLTAAYTHATNIANPHIVTKEQIGLSNADNTADTDKPLSNATKTAIDKTLADAKIYADEKNTETVAICKTYTDTALPQFFTWEKKEDDKKLELVVEQKYTEEDGVYTLFRRISALFTSLAPYEENSNKTCSIGLKPEEFPLNPVTIEGKAITWQNHTILTTCTTSTPSFLLNNGRGLQIMVAPETREQLLTVVIDNSYNLPFTLEIISYALKTPLAAPTNFTSKVENTTLTFSWEAVVGAEYYQIQQYVEEYGGWMSMPENIYTNAFSIDTGGGEAMPPIQFATVAVKKGIQSERSNSITITI